MAEYRDKVVNAELILPGDAGEETVAADDGLFHTKNTSTVTLVGDGTSVNPLTAIVRIDPIEDNALIAGEDGLSVGISTLQNNLLTLAGGKLYVAPPQLTVEISSRADNIISEVTTPGEEGLYASAQPGPEGKQGEKGDPGFGIYMLGPLDNVSQLPVASGQQEGDTYIIDSHYYTIVFGNWTDLGSFAGPAGQDGIGLVIRGSFASTANLPTQGNVSGDAYIIQQQMFVWDGTKWSPVGQVGPQGPEGKQGKTGPVGLTGKQGVPGKDATIFSVKGIKDDESELPTQGNEIGDAWVIGQDVFVYDEIKGFYNIGPVKGVDGKDGVDGKNGVNGKDGVDGNDGQPGSVGPIGPTGIQGKEGKQGDEGLSAYEVAVRDASFTGDVDQWLKSLVGKGIIPRGEVNTYADLPATGNTIGDMFYAAQHTYIWDGSGWVDFGNNSGPQGVEGKQGDPGEDGAEGAAGKDGANGFLPDLTPTQDLGVVSEADFGSQAASLFSGTKPIAPVSYSWWISATDGGADRLAGLTMIPTPSGLYAWFYGPNVLGDGLVGSNFLYKGDDGTFVNIDSLSSGSASGQSGADGNSITAKGYLDNVEDLPDTGNAKADMYYVAGKTYVWDGMSWVDMGSNIGPEGKQGEKGEPGLQGPPGVDGNDGKSSYQNWLDEGNTGSVSDFIDSLRGADGPQGKTGLQGEMGAGVKILGKVATEADLPSTGELGEGYLIDTDFYVWTGSSYDNVGPIQGPQGEPGIAGQDGSTGPVGAEGKKGEQGSLWIVLGQDPTAAIGRVGDYFVNSSTLAFYQKTSGVQWSQLGYLGGGNVYDAPVDGTYYVRQNQAWVADPVQEAPTDGTQYVRNKGAWTAISFPTPAVSEAPTDGQQYVRKNSGWAVFSLPANALTEAPLNTTTYGRSNGQWVGVPPEAPLSAGQYYVRSASSWQRLNRYDLNVTTSTATLDVSLSQIFTVDLSTTKNLTLTNLPSGRAMAIIVVFSGNSFSATWTNTINWTDGVAPTYSSNRTTITLLWDGASLLGFKSGGY